MKKKWRILLVSVMTMVMLLLCIKFWHHYSTTEVIEEETVMLARFESEEIMRIEVRTDRTTTFEKKGGEWYNPDSPTLHYDQTQLNDVVTQLSALVSNQHIRNVQEPTQYGIDEYGTMFSLYNTQGERQDIVLGKYINEYDAYAVWCKEEEILPLVSKQQVELLLTNPQTWIDHELQFPKAESLRALQIKSKDQVVELHKEGDWYMISPYKNPYGVATEKLEDYWKQILQITRDQVMSTTDEREEAYGLATPQLEMMINDEVYLRFGKTEHGQTYFRYKEEPFIYAVDSSKFKALQQIEAFSWLKQPVQVMQPSQLKEIQISYLGKNYLFTREMLADEAVQTGLESLLDMKLYAPIAQGGLENSNPREAELSVTYVEEDGTQRVFELIPYDPSFYLLRDQGYVEFCVEKASVIEGIDYLQQQ